MKFTHYFDSQSQMRKAGQKELHQSQLGEETETWSKDWLQLLILQNLTDERVSYIGY